MKKSLLFTAFVLLLLPSLTIAKDGLPYRFLWHTYRLSNLSFDANDALSITSTIGVNAEDIDFGPESSSGTELVRCLSEGKCIVVWDEQSYSDDITIYSNQPKGSLRLEANWSVEGNLNQPWLLYFLVNGKRLFLSWHHYSMLSALANNSQSGG